jgi:autotransporter-associated beta strand protein
LQFFSIKHKTNPIVDSAHVPWILNSITYNSDTSGGTPGSFTTTGGQIEFNGSTSAITQGDAEADSISNNLLLNVNTTFGGSGTGMVTLSGIISSAGSFTTLTKSGNSKFQLSGTSANTYTGLTLVNAGELDLNKSAATLAVNGNLTIGDGTGGANSDIVKLLANGQILNTATVLINGSSGKLDLNGMTQTIGSLADTGTVTANGSSVNLGGGTLTVGNSASTAFSGTITGTAGNLVKQGTGTLTISGTNTYTGSTQVNAGTLITTNASALGSGNVTVNSAVLNVGNGSPVNLNLDSGTYTQAAGGTLTLQVNDSSAGNYSSVQTSGTAALSGTLNLNVTGSGPAADGTRFQVLNTSTRSGVFSGYTTNLAAGKAFDTSRVEKTGELSVVSHFDGFENVNGTWTNSASTFGAAVTSFVLGASPATPGHAAQVVNAAAASSNAAYGKLTPTALSTIGGVYPATANVGPLTRFNGNSSSFGTGFTTQADIYIDPAWTGDTNGTGFDYSSAVSDSSGNFRRDFIFHVFQSGGTLYAAASNNSDYKADPSSAGIANKLAITTAGWYTVQDTFRDNGGTLAVDVKLFNSGGTSPIYSQTLSAPVDAISGIGGNNYAWFVNIDTGTGASNFLNVDNVKLINNTGSGLSAPAATSGTILLGDATIDSSLAHFDIGGTHPGAVNNGYDHLDVSKGTAHLKGNLSVDFVHGFQSQITPAEQFVVFSADHVTGAFDNVSDGDRVATSDGSGSFLANYQTVGGATQLVLSDFQAIPEPTMLMPVMLGALGLWAGRRRRR